MEKLKLLIIIDLEVGANISNVANKLNTVWSVGNNNAGYGQTAVGNVTVGK